MSASSTGKVAIRVAGHEDIHAVLAVWDSACSPAASTADDFDSVRRLIEHAQDALLVAEFDGKLVGVLVAAWDGWRGNMYRLAVLPAYRRRGIASRLLEAGHERLRAKGARRVSALVAHAGEEALALWSAAGYERDEHLSRVARNL